MAYPQRPPPQRAPPPVRQYGNRPPPPPNRGWHEYGQGGYNGPQGAAYDEYDSYQYGGPEGYHARDDYGHYEAQHRQRPPPPRGHPPHAHEYNGYPNPQRRPPQPAPNRPPNRPPPFRNPTNDGIEPAPRSANSLKNRPWDSPFPAFPTKKRGNSFDLGIEPGMGALDISDGPGAVKPPEMRPHTSNSNHQRPPQYHHHQDPLPPLITNRQPGWPIADSPAQDSYSAPPEHVTPELLPPKRSATMPMNAPPSTGQPRYPGQQSWQEPRSSFEQGGPGAIPPRPATTTGVKPEASAPPSVPPVPEEHNAAAASKSDEDNDDTDDFFDHYLDSGDQETDMPNFSAMDNSGAGGSREESLIPQDNSKGPDTSQADPKPAYTAYQPQNGIIQPYRPPPVSQSQYEEPGYQYDQPQMSPHFAPQNDGYGYPADDPYSRPPENRGMTPRPGPGPGPGPGSGRPGYAPRPPPNQYQQPMPNDIGRRPSLDYRHGYPNPQDMQMGGRGQYPPPDAIPYNRVPFRPGLDQASKPAPVRQYDSQSGVAPQPRPGSTAPPGADPGHITLDELRRLQQAARSNPSDHQTQLLLAKKLVEASVYLIDDGGRADTKTRNKNRERYILDAHKIVKKLVSSGYPDAMFYLADCYGQGHLGLEVDPKEAFNLYQSAAKLGHAESAYRLAVCCEMGHEGGGGTRRDPMKAVQWYRRAAAFGDTPAMYKMGMILLKGLLGQARNPREALSWLKRAAERADADNPHALHELALLYENPSGNDAIIRDENYALELLHQAADLGYKFSQYRLGAAYEYGLMGCPVDPRQSIFWYTRAAAQGEHQSELSLSGWYLTGAEGILQQSDTEAYLWARKAAVAGLAKAEYAMGYFTEVGIGVPANLEDAKRWYWKASSQNFLKARERLEDLKRGGAKMQKTRVSRSAVSKQHQNDGDCVLM
uniref:Chitin synthase regulatory factor n=1 Tax=Coccidioides posadasii RMSCC 3488 TaxID=454284 RepID=A0A0J6IHJ4_COCPO|nr:hypothetical protein CPAG_07609 [Coccidioides posadasii RMSCC 3488]